MAEHVPAADGAVERGAESFEDLAVGAQAGERQAQVVAGPFGGGAEGVFAVGGLWAEAGHQGVAPVVGGVVGSVRLAGADVTALGAVEAAGFDRRIRRRRAGRRTAARRSGGVRTGRGRLRAGGRRRDGPPRPSRAGRAVQRAANTWSSRASGSRSFRFFEAARAGSARIGVTSFATAACSAVSLAGATRRGWRGGREAVASAVARAARMRSRRTEAGSSLGSWGTSSPRNALAKIEESSSARLPARSSTLCSVLSIRLSASSSLRLKTSISCSPGSGTKRWRSGVAVDRSAYCPPCPSPSNDNTLVPRRSSGISKRTSYRRSRRASVASSSRDR